MHIFEKENTRYDTGRRIYSGAQEYKSQRAGKRAGGGGRKELR